MKNILESADFWYVLQLFKYLIKFTFKASFWYRNYFKLVKYSSNHFGKFLKFIKEIYNEKSSLSRVKLLKENEVWIRNLRLEYNKINNFPISKSRIRF